MGLIGFSHWNPMYIPVVVTVWNAVDWVGCRICDVSCLCVRVSVTSRSSECAACAAADPDTRQPTCDCCDVAAAAHGPRSSGRLQADVRHPRRQLRRGTEIRRRQTSLHDRLSRSVPPKLHLLWSGLDLLHDTLYNKLYLISVVQLQPLFRISAFLHILLLWH